MNSTTSVPTPSSPAALRILYLEDNPLIVFHVEQLVEDLGHVFVGSLDSFALLKDQFDALEFDAALVDIDLADGSTGPDAAAGLHARGVPSIFVTGQEQVAVAHGGVSRAVITKPIAPAELAEKIELLR
jgi:CheY-like chemotaxis protein